MKTSEKYRYIYSINCYSKLRNITWKRLNYFSSQVGRTLFFCYYLFNIANFVLLISVNFLFFYICLFSEFSFIFYLVSSLNIILWGWKFLKGEWVSSCLLIFPVTPIFFETQQIHFSLASMPSWFVPFSRFL